MKRITIAFCLLVLCVPHLFGGVITGRVGDRKTGEPVPYATVRVEGTGRSMLANEHGLYRLRLDPGRWQLRFSHVAYYSERIDLLSGDTAMTLDVTLQPAMIEVSGARVYERAYDPAQQIIIQAIARKQEILSQLARYRFDAYTKLMVCDTAKDDSSHVVIITETQLECFWEQPDRYKELITARRQTSNLEADQNLATIGRILDFNKNRLDLGRYSVVSPTAKDALDHYNYYLLDTIFYDHRPVFRLEIEPKNSTAPLFVGTIDIADSSYAVVGVEVGFSEGIETPFFENFLYRLRYDQFDNEYWMPIEIGFAGILNLPVPGLPVYSIDYVAALYDYSFEVEHAPGTFDYVLEVAEEADEVDSVAWYAAQMIPLTPIEKRGYFRIDSLENAPRPFYKRALGGLARVMMTLTDPDFFHFNRVEGAYLGYGARRYHLLPRTDLRMKAGYAFDRKRWQHEHGITCRLWNARRLDLEWRYRNDIVHRPTLISPPDYNPTLLALADKTDPFDYYLEKGFRVSVGADLLKRVRANVGYRDGTQHSEVNHTEYSLFRESKRHRANPAIVDGKLRSLTASLAYDSRPLMKLKGREDTMDVFPFVRIETGVETASPDLIDNDFQFTRYHTRLRYSGRSVLPGATELMVYGGASDRTLPPQEYFTVDYADDVLGYTLAFKTLGESNFAGSRAAAVYLSHNFGTWPFRKSGLPLIRKIPFSLSLHGGAFWTDFTGHPKQPGDDRVRTAPKAYREIGFALGRIPPMFFRVYFTWQLSDYGTLDFTVLLGTAF